MNDQKFMLSPYRAKYNAMRLSLLFILVFSTINLFSPLLGFYMLFSAYIPQLIAEIGAVIYLEEGVLLVYVICVFLALILLLPYLLCYIFSKKKVGWMIGALVLFSIDTLFFLFDFISVLVAGDFTYVIDLLFHIYALVSLILAVKYGKDTETEMRPDYDAIASQSENDVIYGDATRTLTLTRKKSFVGCAMKMTITVNGVPVCVVKNGETASVAVPCVSFALGAAFQNTLVASQSIIQSGDTNLFYTLSIKQGFSSSEILFIPSENQKN